MNRLDPEIRTRILRVAIALLGVIAVSILIGLTAGRPFDSSNATGNRATVTSGPSAPPSPTATVTPLPTTSATPAPPTPTAPPPTPEDGWLIRSRELFDHPSTWPAKEEVGWASGYEDGRYWLKLNGQRTISYRVPLDATEFRITTDVQVKQGYAGLLFLADDSNGVYRFLVDDAGRYLLERQRGGEVTTLKDWTAAPAMKPGPDAVNQIEVRRVENEITLFVNDAKLTTYALPANAKLHAQIGLTLDAVARDSVAMAYFDNLVVRVPAVPASP
jgi:hypothetical protein